ncbi:MAG: MerR family transcriptional regulator [Lachnospiraceae bacterium]|nr:MerR family transcriptional regulator [Lachnospiraceae bacterium]
MTIKELEIESGISRANIRFYEKEGFLAPIRKANGYREYSPGDLELLLKIKLLRNLHVSLEEIRALQQGEVRLGDTLQKKIDELEQEKKNITNIQEVCRTMRMDQAAFGNLQAGKYLEQLERLALECGGTEERQLAPRIYAPYRRLFARVMDFILMEFVCAMFVVFVFRESMLEVGDIGWGAVCLCALFLAWIMEPHFLHWFGTTPGKAIFGIRIVKTDGSKLLAAEARERLYDIITTYLGASMQGMFSLRTSRWNRENYELEGNYWYGNKDVDLPWEKHNHAYTIKENTLPRALLYIGILVLSVWLQLNPNIKIRPALIQGELTAEQYTENVNRFIWGYCDKNSSYQEWELLSSGYWREKEQKKNYTVIYHTGEKFVPNRLTIQTNAKGDVEQVSFTVKKTASDDWLSGDTELQWIAAGALLGAEKKCKAKQLRQLEEKLSADPFASVRFTIGNVQVSRDIIIRDYSKTDYFLIPSGDASANPYFELVFVVSRIK